MKKSIVAASVVWAFATSASAGLLLDFNAHALGSTLTDQYAAYGLRFENVETGRTLERGTFLRAGFTLYVDPSILSPGNDQFGVAFLGFTPNDQYIDVLDRNGLALTRSTVGGLANPFCNTQAECEAGGFHYALNKWGSGLLWIPGDAYKITFSVDVDNMYFGTDAADIPGGTYPGRTEIPEPGSLALLGLGLGLASLTLAGRRRRG